MSVWMPLAKADLPVLARVAEKAIPAFASHRAQSKSLDERSAQIAELQSVATDNAASIKAVAEQLEETIRAVDRGVEETQARLNALETALRRTRIAALCVAAIALVALGRRDRRVARLTSFPKRPRALCSEEGGARSMRPRYIYLPCRSGR